MYALPRILNVILKELKLVQHIHSRGPSVPALLALGLSFIFKSKVWWHKYAGNWNEIAPPLSYRAQRFLLKKLKNTHVTINGFWPKQPKHCISFENPCLTEEQLQMGSQVLQQKKFEPPFNFLFIGRLEDAKGVGLIIEAIRKIDKSLLNVVKFIGDGPKRAEYEQRTQDLNYVTFLGGLGNDIIHEELKQTDFLLLPSVASEGFPKVIAEAACYGVVPIVSDVGSISHYIKANNGFICDSVNIVHTFEIQLHNALKTESIQLKQKSIQVSEIARLFTFNAYLDKLQHHIFAR
jgi:glycosyltransferase involved in cell wall biosynthesis